MTENRGVRKSARPFFVPLLFSPGIWWIGFRMNLSGSDIQNLQIYSQAQNSFPIMTGR